MHSGLRSKAHFPTPFDMLTSSSVTSSDIFRAERPLMTLGHTLGHRIIALTCFHRADSHFWTLCLQGGLPGRFPHNNDLQLVVRILDGTDGLHDLPSGGAYLRAFPQSHVRAGSKFRSVHSCPSAKVASADFTNSRDIILQLRCVFS